MTERYPLMQRSTYLKLHFATAGTPQLMRIEFDCPCLEQRNIGIRGNDVPAGTLPFRWSTSTQALALFFVKTVQLMHKDTKGAPVLEGYSGCPAATLSRLLTKRPDGWLLDVFGYGPNGRTLLSRILLCRNYSRSLPGPIQIFMRSGLLHPSEIEILLDNEDITEDAPAISSLIHMLEKTWTPNLNHEPKQQSALLFSPSASAVRDGKSPKILHNDPSHSVIELCEHSPAHRRGVERKGLADKQKADAPLGRTADSITEEPEKRRAPLPKSAQVLPQRRRRAA